MTKYLAVWMVIGIVSTSILAAWMSGKMIYNSKLSTEFQRVEAFGLIRTFLWEWDGGSSELIKKSAEESSKWSWFIFRWIMMLSFGAWAISIIYQHNSQQFQDFGTAVWTWIKKKSQKIFERLVEEMHKNSIQ